MDMSLANDRDPSVRNTGVTGAAPQAPPSPRRPRVMPWATGAAFVLIACATGAQAAPQLKGGTSQICRDTLIVARAAFYSKSFYLNEAVTLPLHSGVEIIAQKTAGYISGGKALDFDPKVFKEVDKVTPDSRGWLYRQAASVAGRLWLIDDEIAGWHGDRYSVYNVDAVAPPAASLSDADLVVGTDWEPPMILRHVHSNELWAVAAGYDFGEFTDWTVYGSGKDGVKARCTISFSRPVKNTIALLPAPARKLAKLLDDTLGDGRGEGSLHPTGLIRFDVQAGWANVAVRPWAVNKQPCNSRRDVNRALKNWSHRAPAFRALYLQIQAQYPLALQSLTDLYATRFGKTPDQAKAMATRNLDLIYRSHFVFPQDAIHSMPDDAKLAK